MEEARFHKVLKKLDQIQDKLDLIDKKLELINNSTTNMDNHISFIEVIYNRVKHPLNYIISTFSPNTLTLSSQHNNKLLN